ncbi:hypothetical protein VNO77_01445 [Canavalia gladiata]|uniref:Uncharacterized protein n=1 Tax=Canavalia gladiata TaxID=3824 RepID=A0AAN9MR56_CANGL
MSWHKLVRENGREAYNASHQSHPKPQESENSFASYGVPFGVPACSRCTSNDKMPLRACHVLLLPFAKTKGGLNCYFASSTPTCHVIFGFPQSLH